MRRSAAPSQLGPANKRPRFNSPLTGSSDSSSRSTQDILKLIQKPESYQRGPENVPGSSGNNSDSPGLSHIQIRNEQSLADILETGISAGGKFQLEEIHLEQSHTGTENKQPDTKHTNSSPRGDSGDKNTSTDSDKVKSRPFKPVFKSCKAPLLSRNGPAANVNRSTFTCPKSQQPSTKQNEPTQQITGGESGPKSKYFNVMWCKLSKKKHKKWEGDAILVTKGRTVSLLDTDGKEIGRGSGYKTSELMTLDEGHTLGIGGKEIEVMSVLSEENFKSGVCFTGGSTSQQSSNDSPPSLKLLKSGVSKPFNKPTKGEQSASVLVQNTAPVKPRHDPDVPNALVMPVPSNSHQWEHNKGQLQVVDVVVDPYLSQHLRPHQRAGVVFLYECIMGMKDIAGRGAILADEMGLGKTLQCISLIWTLLKQGPYGGKSVVRKVLVITPGSLVKNWLKEFKKWLGTERLKVFAVGQDNKVTDFVDAPMYPVLIVSYEMFMRTVETIRTVNFDLIICDEGHRLKNTNIKTTSLVNSLPCRRRVVLTGTPVQNDLQELYSIVDFCNPSVLGTASAFRHVYEEAILTSRRPGASPEDLALGETRATELNRITGLFILRRTSDINNKYLPPKVDLVLFCRPSPLQLSLYRQLLSSRVVRSCLYSGDGAQHLMCISALRKLCNNPSLLYKKAEETATTEAKIDGTPASNDEAELYSGLYKLYPPGYEPRSPAPHLSGKLSVLAELLSRFHESSKERVVLVSNYTQTLDTLEDLCKSCGYQFLRLDGQTPTGKRQQLVERFNSSYSKDFVFLLSSKAGGIGLNLIGASRLILYDIDWNPANDLQAMARVWREGQRHAVYIYRLLSSGTIEEKMYQRQITKQALSGVVVDAKSSSNNQVQFSPEELRDLFVLKESTLCATHDVLDCQCLTSQPPAEHPLPSEAGRSCQIGRTGKVAKKNLCMDELFQWQHIPGPSPSLDMDPLLAEASLEKVNFVFCCKSNFINQQPIRDAPS